MLITRVILRNWKNFRKVDVSLRKRVFIAGPNASGKSNFLDVFKFLRDIAKTGGGLQQAVEERGGLSKIRCLSARQEPDVGIELHLAENPEDSPVWKYAISIKQEPRGHRKSLLAYERVWHGDECILDRPDKNDEDDQLRLTQTHLEQINANLEFRDIAKFFDSVLYMHLVPQLLKNPKAFSGHQLPGDPYGKNFLDRIARTTERTRKSRLRKIESALIKAVPMLKQLTDTKDESGIPHLEAIYEHWRPHGAKQREDQFSDGTLRLIALLWCLLESDSLLLLEEPEISLNGAIVRTIPSLIHRVQRKKDRQVIISTHSGDLLDSQSIGGEEVLFLTPSSEGTEMKVASDVGEIKLLLQNGFTPAEAILPRTEPRKCEQGLLFDV